MSCSSPQSWQMPPDTTLSVSPCSQYAHERTNLCVQTRACLSRPCSVNPCRTYRLPIAFLSRKFSVVLGISELAYQNCFKPCTSVDMLDAVGFHALQAVTFILAAGLFFCEACPYHTSESWVQVWSTLPAVRRIGIVRYGFLNNCLNLRSMSEVGQLPVTVLSLHHNKNLDSNLHRSRNKVTGFPMRVEVEKIDHTRDFCLSSAAHGSPP